MLWILALVMFGLWLIGLVSAHAFGGLIHILLLVAAVAVLIRLIQGRRAVTQGRLPVRRRR